MVRFSQASQWGESQVIYKVSHVFASRKLWNTFKKDYRGTLCSNRNRMGRVQHTNAHWAAGLLLESEYSNQALSWGSLKSFKKTRIKKKFTTVLSMMKFWSMFHTKNNYRASIHRIMHRTTWCLVISNNTLILSHSSFFNQYKSSLIQKEILWTKTMILLRSFFSMKF